MTFANIEIAQPGDGVVLLRLAGSADRVNTLSLPFLQELSTAVGRLQERGGVKLLAITGKGRTFSAGADLEELRTCGERGVRSFLAAGQSLIRQIMALDFPTVAAINGLALGGGLELALACDIRWTHRRAVLGLPEAKLGLLPGWGGVSLLEHLVPEPFARGIVASGDFVSARRAFDVGLASRLFEELDFEAAVLGELELMAAMTGEELGEIREAARRTKENADLATCDEAFLPLWNGWKQGQLHA
jgi:enoyl-CoA hydratase/carnithine racemase